MATSDACLGCGLRSPKSDVAPDRRYNASGACWQLNLDLTAYTLTLGDKEFLHQLAVDTYGAQRVGEHSRPIGVAFALIGLYLTCDCGYTGRQVQHVHMLMANRTKTWPQFSPPVGRYRMTVADVLTLAPGSGGMKPSGIGDASSGKPGSPSTSM